MCLFILIKNIFLFIYIYFFFSSSLLFFFFFSRLSIYHDEYSFHEKTENKENKKKSFRRISLLHDQDSKHHFSRFGKTTKRNQCDEISCKKIVN